VITTRASQVPVVCADLPLS